MLMMVGPESDPLPAAVTHVSHRVGLALKADQADSCHRCRPERALRHVAEQVAVTRALDIIQA